MKKSTAVLLALIAAGLLALAFTNRTNNIASDAGKPFLPELKSQLAAVNEVVIQDQSADVVMKLAGESWQVANRDGYPANVENLRKLLRNLADTTLVERKTDNPELHYRLGVAGIDQTGEKDATINIQLKAADKTVVNILVGDRSDRGSYVRKVDDNQSWLINRDFLPSAEPSEWLDESLISIKREQLQKVEVQPEAGPAYEMVRGEDDEFVISPVPEGREPGVSAVARIAGAMRSLQINDVKKDENQPTNGWAESRWYSKQGLVVTVISRMEDGDTFARITASVTPEASEEAKVTASTLNARTKGRIIALPSHQANNLRLTLEQVTTEIDKG